MKRSVYVTSMYCGKCDCSKHILPHKDKNEIYITKYNLRSFYEQNSHSPQTISYALTLTFLYQSSLM